MGVKERNFFRFLLLEYWALSWLAIILSAVFFPSHILSIIGLYFVGSNLYELAKWLYKHFLRKPKSNLRAKYGGWALITGASEGIGRALALEYAARGFPIILISRTQSKLEGVAKEIRDRYKGIEVRIITADFSDQERKWMAKIKAETAGLEIGVLVNNVGSADSIPTDFLEVPDEFMNQMFELNIYAATLMTRIFMPQMVERKRGAVMNVGSCSASHPTPMLALYSATKAYLRQWSECLTYEYREKGIDVIMVSPYYVVSSLSGIKNASLLVPTAETFAEAALRDLGYGESYSNPYYFHAFFEWASKIYSRTPERIHKMMKNSRERNMARQKAGDKRTSLA
eukprot:TRINITY_DN728_c0_g1_i1.p1 TRINITY_DN728_c0_g1~~TRINITY_DN728_c0_g1_i1.p1  ORF type:complete len:342 (+),score=82.64 TRINITY_DN728_c0_g1_i1:54-1079(+)